MNILIGKNALVLGFLFTSCVLFSQNVGINLSGATPSASAILDLNTGNSGNLGLNIPNVSLSTTLTTFGMAAAAVGTDKGMLVYNTNTSAGNGVGYYYWDGGKWVFVGAGAVLANNGLYMSTDTVQLGDPSTAIFPTGNQFKKNRIVTQNSFNMTYDLDENDGDVASSGYFAIQNGGTSLPYFYVTPASTGGSDGPLVGIGNNAPGANLLNVSTTANTSGIGNGILLTAQQGSASQNGGAVAITGGQSGSSGTGGAVTIAGGAGNTGEGGAVTIKAGTSASAAGNIANIAAGAGNGAAANGGVASLVGGAAGSSGTGGEAIIQAGASATSGAGGAASLTAGAGGGAGAGGADSIIAGTGGATGAGGNILVKAGKGGSTSGTGGAVTVAGGSSPTSGQGGAVRLIAGASTTTQPGSNVALIASNAIGGTVTNGGGIDSITSGTGGTTGPGGAVDITAGAGGTTGVATALGGNVNIAAGTGGGATSGVGAVGGNVNINAGNANGTGNNNGGNIVMSVGTASNAGNTGGVAINTNGAAPNSDAILDLTNTANLGFLPPGISTTNLPAITNAQNGLIVFNTTLGYPEFALNGTWYPMYNVSHSTSAFSETGSPQYWVVPPGITTITITAKGAQGGSGDNNNAGRQGGDGAVVIQTFTVRPGDSLEMVVGNTGTNGGTKGGGGGGGGTFVWDVSGTNKPTEPMIVAGGGGGGGYSSAGLTGNSSAITEDYTAGDQPVGTSSDGGPQGTGTAADGEGGGGGGWNSAGSGASTPAEDGGGGGTWVGFAAGAAATGGTAGAGAGGYGGGGGGGYYNGADKGAGGGGGGYSGGGGGIATSTTIEYSGAGGGSGYYNGSYPYTTAADFVAPNPTNVSNNVGAGSVSITY